MMIAPFATVFVHPNVTAAQAEHLCHAEGFALARTERGNFRLAPKPPAPQGPGMTRIGATPSPLITSAAAGGSDEPLEAA